MLLRGRAQSEVYPVMRGPKSCPQYSWKKVGFGDVLIAPYWEAETLRSLISLANPPSLQSVTMPQNKVDSAS